MLEVVMLEVEELEEVVLLLLEEVVVEELLEVV